MAPFDGSAASSRCEISCNPPLMSSRAPPSKWLARRLQRIRSCSSAEDNRPGWAPELEHAQALQNGTYLDLYADNLLEDFLAQSNAVPVRDRVSCMTYSTMCSGSDICKEALAALSRAFAKAGHDVRFDQKWACEIDPQKRQWLLGLHENKICVFMDARHLSASSDFMAYCETHKQRCLVVPTQALLVGFSCKEFSRANSSSKVQKSNLLKSASSSGSSVETYRSMVAHIEETKPSFIMIENSDALCDGSEKEDSNLNVLLATLSSYGYDSQAMLLNTAAYGLPNRRPRTYIVAVLVENVDMRIKSLDAYFKNFVLMLDRAKRDPPSATDCLLPDNERLVKEQLELRQNKPHVAWEPGSIEIHQKHYATKGLRWGSLRPNSRTQNSAWFATLTARGKDTLVCNMHLYPHEDAFDIGQSIYRVPHSSKFGACDAVVGPALLPGAVVWWASRGRLQIGYEALMFTGFPVAKHLDLIKRFPNDFLMSLAGNAFSGTIVTAIFAVLVAFTPWAQAEPRGAQSEEGEQAVQRQEVASQAATQVQDLRGDGDSAATDPSTAEAMRLLRMLRRSD